MMFIKRQCICKDISVECETEDKGSIDVYSCYGEYRAIIDFV